MSSSITSQSFLKKAKPAFMSDEHFLISCVYIAELNNGGIPVSKQTSVINLRANNILADISNSTISFCPSIIQRALASSKASFLYNRGSLKCSNCDGEASHVCSSVAVSRGTNNDSNVSEKGEILLVSEHLISSCGGDTCQSEARQRRNQTSLKKEHGYGFLFAFRCALKPITKVLESLPSGKD